MVGRRTSTLRAMWAAAKGRTVVGVSAEDSTTLTLARLRESRARQAAVQRWLRLLAPVVLVLLALTAVRARPGPSLSGRGLATSAALLGFALGAVGVFGTLRRVGYFHVAFVGLMAVSSAVLMWLQPSGPGSVGVFLSALLVSLRLPSRAGVPLSVGSFLGVAGIAVATGRGPGVALLTVLGAFVGMGYLANQLGEANNQAEQLLIQLEQSRSAEARAAGLAERQRLAREMHDVLAHSLSGLTLQLEGARMLAAGEGADPRLLDVLERAHRLSRTGLDEARRAIGMLRDQELPGPERLAGLAAQFQLDRNIPCHFAVHGNQCAVGPQVSLALYRVAQEALTNIAKHSQAERVELILAYEPNSVRVLVEDFSSRNGTLPIVASEPGAGYGLTGMRERAELLGGKLTTEAKPGGFRVELEVPI